MPRAERLVISVQHSLLRELVVSWLESRSEVGQVTVMVII